MILPSLTAALSDGPRCPACETPLFRYPDAVDGLVICPTCAHIFALDAGCVIRNLSPWEKKRMPRHTQKKEMQAMQARIVARMIG